MSLQSFFPVSMYRVTQILDDFSFVVCNVQ